MLSWSLMQVGTKATLHDPIPCTMKRVEAMTPECPFCRRIAEGNYDRSGEHSVSFLDAHPVSQGHTLVVPRRHVSSVFDLSATEYSDLWNLVRTVKQAIKADGFNLGVNDGPVAGQTVEHAHVHLIPRRKGDAADPRGGIRAVFPDRAKYWSD